MRFKHILWATVGISVVVCVLLFALWKGISGSTFDLEETEYVYVRPGDDADAVCEKLSVLSGSNINIYWKVLNLIRPYKLHTGRYAVEPGQSFVTTYLNLQRGHQTPVRFTLPSVRTMDRLAGVLSRKFMMDSTEVVQQLTDSSYARQYGHSTYTLPALFIPNTYEIYWDTPLDKFMERMQHENERFWQQEGREEAAKAIGFTHEEVATLASIVDEETANNAEKPRVAGLYMNRLQKGIPLQADPTVKFAVGDVTLRRIRGEHLKKESPYNTYLHQGLPPGPIRIPSIAGIDAVLHMEHHNYIYMCAKEDFSGTHNFAATFPEHRLNARRYQKALNERGIH